MLWKTEQVKCFKVTITFKLLLKNIWLLHTHVRAYIQRYENKSRNLVKSKGRGEQRARKYSRKDQRYRGSIQEVNIWLLGVQLCQKKENGGENAIKENIPELKNRFLQITRVPTEILITQRPATHTHKSSPLCRWITINFTTLTKRIPYKFSI